MKENKRGLSTIVETVLVVLLTIAAAYMLAAFVIPYIRNQLTTGTECLDYREYLQFDESFELNCYVIKDSGKAYIFSLGSKSDQALAEKFLGFHLELQNNASGKSIKVLNTTVESCTNNGIMVYDGEACDTTSLGTISIPSPGEKISYAVYSDSALEYTKAKVIPIIKGGNGKERACDEAYDEIKIAACLENYPV